MHCPRIPSPRPQAPPGVMVLKVNLHALEGGLAEPHFRASRTLLPPTQNGAGPADDVT
ncbi:hypothetical protein AURDEDRAFT_140407 [Auricularia subglabra TFB-10046 SS5]|uniref:Uncharacterized protein n=1 Tax=Auricularia subglabra (strain TFB-10046 / SS5) TaxID=717982 RepID=J0LEI8_AURST|nr:hypothetical protein AURDEDRAFT_140407 [Auricularia subglabra TFB-10046 SS5]